MSDRLASFNQKRTEFWRSIGVKQAAGSKDGLASRIRGIGATSRLAAQAFAAINRLHVNLDATLWH